MTNVTTLIVGDTHADASFVSAIHKQARHFDATCIVQLGDFGYTFDKNMMDSIRAWLNRDEHHVWYWVDGNHDHHDYLDWLKAETGLDQPWVAPIPMREYHDRLFYVPRGAKFMIGTTGCLGLGGAYSIDKAARRPHESWWPQETITEADVYRCVSRVYDSDFPIEVMFTHDAPTSDFLEDWLDKFGYKVGGESKHNRQVLTHVVDHVRPRMLYHGHYHKRYSTVYVTPEGWDVHVEGIGANVKFEGGRQWLDSTPHLDGNFVVRVF